MRQVSPVMSEGKSSLFARRFHLLPITRIYSNDAHRPFKTGQTEIGLFAKRGHNRPRVDISMDGTLGVQ